MQEKTTRQIIRAARRILRQPGKWRKCAIGSPETGMCLLGGIAHAAGISLNAPGLYETLRHTPAVNALKDVILKKDLEFFGRYDDSAEIVYMFNDSADRKQQEVVDLLTETLKSLPKE